MFSQIKFYFRTIAVVLAWLLALPPASWMAGSRQWQAHAQSGVQLPACGTYPKLNPIQPILETVCDGTAGPYTADLVQLETDAVTSYLAIHDLPTTEAATLYNYGRSDLRTEIRGLMLTNLLSIIGRAPNGNTGNYGNLSPHEINLYKWMSANVTAEERALYTVAEQDKNNFLNNPCTWTPDAEIAQAYGLTYYPPGGCVNGAGTPSGPALGTVPSVSYFEGAALKNTYGQLVNFTGGPALLNQTALTVANAVIATIAVATTIATIATLSAGSITALTAIAPAICTTTSSIFGASTAFVASIGSALALVAIPLTMLAIGIIMIIDLANHDQQISALSAVDNDLAWVNSPNYAPDLLGMAEDSTGLLKLQMVFLPFTEYRVLDPSSASGYDVQPEFASTATLPSHLTTDPTFNVTSNGQTTLQQSFTYQDPGGFNWTAATHGGWFVQHHAGSPTDQGSITTTLEVRLPNGDFGSVGLTGSNFLITDVILGSKGGSPCPADPVTAVTKGSLANCSSYVANTATFLDGNLNPMTIQVNPVPSFTSPSTATIDPTGSANQQFSISATQNAAITLAGSLPAGMTFTPGNGQATLSYTPPPGASANTASQTVTLTATNTIGGAGSQTLTVLLQPHLQLLTPNTATFTIGVFQSFNVWAAGAGPITLTPEGLGGGSTPLPAGLSFQPFGLPTSSGAYYTLSGTAQAGATGCMSTGCGLLLTQGTGSGATNTFLPFYVNIVSSPPATYTGATTVNFTAGVDNSVDLTAQGAPPGIVSWSLVSGPSWLQLSLYAFSNTALLSGTPPSNTTGSFPVVLNLSTYGAGSTAVNLTIRMNPGPMFTDSGNIHTYTMSSNTSPTPVSFPLDTNQLGVPGTTISMTGGLPPGVTFADGGEGVASVSGSTSVGGYYPLQFTVSNVTGSATESYYVRVLQPPAFTTANSANFVVGYNNTFTVSTSGYPMQSDASGPGGIPNSTGMALTMSGSVPSWLHFSPASSAGANSGTAVLSGTPPAGSQGTYQLTLQAANGVNPSALQTFALVVSSPPAMTRQQLLQGAGAVGAALQGSAVALSADGQTAIVGSPADNNNSGAAWIYSWNGGWSQQGNKLATTLGAVASQQGASVALSADGNTAVVGSAGQLFLVYTRGNGVWSQATPVTAPAGSAGVAIATGSSLPNSARILAGVPQNNSFFEYYPASSAIWTNSSTFMVGDAIGNAQFGTSISLSADGNTAVVGGPGDNGNVGAAWILTRGATQWQEVAKLTASSLQGSAGFGTSVAISSDGSTVMVGAPSDAANQGSAWLFTRIGGAWGSGMKVAPNDFLGQAQFGASVALCSDGSIAMAGGPGDNGGNGAAWFFTRANGAWTQSGGKQVGAGSGIKQGASVALSANGSVALAGAPLYGSGAGAAWAYGVSDLGISISHSGTGILLSPLTYTVTLNNIGGDYSSPGAAAWSLTFPSNLAPLSVSGPAGWICSPTGCADILNTMQPGGSAHFTMNTIAVGAGPLTVTAAVNNLQLSPNKTASDSTTIAKLTPVLSWPQPAPITFGSALGPSQLNAAANSPANSASVPGTFTYTPPAGTVLGAGNGQTLSVVFTPNDLTDWNSAGASTTINVLPPAGGGATPAKLVVTETLSRDAGNNVVATLTFANSGGTAAQSVTLTSAKIGTASGTPLPQSLGTINAGASMQTTVTFPASVGASGAASILSLAGTYSGGTVSSSARIVLP